MYSVDVQFVVQILNLDMLCDVAAMQIIKKVRDLHAYPMRTM